ncbi:MAG: glycosyltransferase [Eubacterium sp.]|nr:glycosyltransferase [Eubacterium sp.]
MSDEIKVSVIIPVYNSEKYLEKCLDSIVSQTIQGLEVLCINDGSNDLSLQILEDYSSRYKNIKVVSYEENKGQAYARNRGLDEACGKYIYFADSDDQLLDTKALEMLYACAQKEHLDAVLFDAEIIYETDLMRQFCSPDDLKMKHNYESVYNGEDFVTEVIENEEFKPAVWLQFWKAEYLRTNHIMFRADASPHEDLLFSFQALLLSSRIRHIKKSCYRYLLRQASSSRGVNLKRYQAYTLCYFYLYEFCAAHDFSKRTLNILFVYMKPIKKYLKEKSIELLKMGCDVQELVFEKPVYSALLQNILTEDYMLLGRVFHLTEYEKLSDSAKIIVYGAGMAGRDIMKLLHAYGISDYLLAVTQIDHGTQYHLKQQVCPIKELACYSQQSVVLLAATKKYQAGMLENLQQLGFNSYICLL